MSSVVKKKVSEEAVKVIIIGGGAAGLGTADCLAKVRNKSGGLKYDITVVEGREDVLCGTTNGATPRLGGMHYKDKETAKQYFKAAIEFAKKYPGCILSPGNKSQNSYQRGWYLLVQNKNAKSNSMKALDIKFALTEYYKQLIKRDNKNKVFGEPDKLFEPLAFGNLAGTVNPEKICMALETAEKTILWNEFKEKITSDIARHSNVKIVTDAWVKNVKYDGRHYTVHAKKYLRQDVLDSLNMEVRLASKKISSSDLAKDILLMLGYKVLNNKKIILALKKNSSFDLERKILPILGREILNTIAKSIKSHNKHASHLLPQRLAKFILALNSSANSSKAKSRGYKILHDAQIPKRKFGIRLDIDRDNYYIINFELQVGTMLTKDSGVFLKIVSISTPYRLENIARVVNASWENIEKFQEKMGFGVSESQIYANRAIQRPIKSQRLSPVIYKGRSFDLHKVACTWRLSSIPDSCKRLKVSVVAKLPLNFERDVNNEYKPRHSMFFYYGPYTSLTITGKLVEHILKKYINRRYVKALLEYKDKGQKNCTLLEVILRDFLQKNLCEKNFSNCLKNEIKKHVFKRDHQELIGLGLNSVFKQLLHVSLVNIITAILEFGLVRENNLDKQLNKFLQDSANLKKFFFGILKNGLYSMRHSAGKPLIENASNKSQMVSAINKFFSSGALEKYIKKKKDYLQQTIPNKFLERLLAVITYEPVTNIAQTQDRELPKNIRYYMYGNPTPEECESFFYAIIKGASEYILGLDKNEVELFEIRFGIVKTYGKAVNIKDNDGPHTKRIESGVTKDSINYFSNASMKFLYMLQNANEIKQLFEQSDGQEAILSELLKEILSATGLSSINSIDLSTNTASSISARVLKKVIETHLWSYTNPSNIIFSSKSDRRNSNKRKSCPLLNSNVDEKTITTKLHVDSTITKPLVQNKTAPRKKHYDIGQTSKVNRRYLITLRKSKSDEHSKKSENKFLDGMLLSTSAPEKFSMYNSSAVRKPKASMRHAGRTWFTWDEREQINKANSNDTEQGRKAKSLSPRGVCRQLNKEKPHQDIFVEKYSTVILKKRKLINEIRNIYPQTKAGLHKTRKLMQVKDCFPCYPNATASLGQATNKTRKQSIVVNSQHISLFITNNNECNIKFSQRSSNSAMDSKSSNLSKNLKF